MASFHSSSSPLFTSPLCSPSFPVRRARTCLRGSSCFSCNFSPSLCPARPNWWFHSSHSSFLYPLSRPFPHQALRLAFGGFFFACPSLDAIDNWCPSFLPLLMAVLLFCSPISSTSFTIFVYTAYKYMYIHIYIYLYWYIIYMAYVCMTIHIFNYYMLLYTANCTFAHCTPPPACAHIPSNMSVSFIT